jgi:four helix bundle protein
VSTDWLPRFAAVSIPANISEGFGRWHSKEFIHFLLIAIGSLKELETHLLIGKRLGFFSPSDLDKPEGLVGGIGRMLAALRKRLEC